MQSNQPGQRKWGMAMQMKWESGQSSRPDVAVVGELNPDLIVYGVPREIPEERDLLAHGFTFTLGSSSAILAHNLSLLGNKVIFSSKIGEDPLGEMCCKMMEKANVELGGVVRSTDGTATGVTLILPLEITRRSVTYPGTMDQMGIEDLDLDYISSARHFHLSSYFLHRKLIADIPGLFREMKQRGLTTSLDTNDDPADKWEGVVENVLPWVDVLLGTETELERMAKVKDGAERIASQVPLLVVKRGAGGASAYTNEQRLDMTALKVDVVDAVGAGDTFDAGFLHQWLRGAPLQTCLAYGNLAGGLSVTRPGGIQAFCDAAYRNEFFARHWKDLTLIP
jgi:sugar/nucleoside kinase (ribokinase family)